MIEFSANNLRGKSKCKENISFCWQDFDELFEFLCSILRFLNNLYYYSFFIFSMIISNYFPLGSTKLRVCMSQQNFLSFFKLMNNVFKMNIISSTLIYFSFWNNRLRNNRISSFILIKKLSREFTLNCSDKRSCIYQKIESFSTLYVNIIIKFIFVVFILW